jgi:hypothetical protein
LKSDSSDSSKKIFFAEQPDSAQAVDLVGLTDTLIPFDMLGPGSVPKQYSHLPAD